LGSSFELETQLLIVEAVKYGNSALITDLLKEVDLEQKMLLSFNSKLNK